MSPLFSSDSALEPGENYKFVRDGDKVAYETRKSRHSNIARANNIGDDDLDLKNDLASRRLDDAGWLKLRGEIIIVWASSSSCQLRGEHEEARTKTCEVISKITGRRIEAR